ncbi:MAG TPA: efflux RND transporter periplasmic adaptor subunit [Thermoanaerobaculia bacterium]|nr:efflux RND transporter periplasmic adaptor subunit [Thermoanaerobaculia bacterium]
MSRTTKLVIISALVVILAVGSAALFLRSGDDHGNRAGATAAEMYYCPMHPTVTSDRPGSCPICGMALVKRTSPDPAAAQLAADGSLAAVSLSPEQRVTANVRTLRVTPATHTSELVTTGRVTFDERRLAQVTSYSAGRIERLYVNFTGDTVRRGEAVAAIYSPDLFATQQEYLLALANRERMRGAGFDTARSASQDLVESTKRRLQLFGMTAGQITQLERTGQPLFATTVVSPVSGIVTKRLVVPQQYVEQGQTLLELADLSNIWVEVDVYEQQLPGLAIGQTVLITSPALPGIEFRGTVSFIQPVLSGETRTARVRVELPNPRLQLKPDMYVSVRIFGMPAPAHIMVPKSAIVDRGRNQFVWVETRAGTYEPRQVTTAERHGDDIVIVSGVESGDVVVVEGAFLLDSEAQLREATSGAMGASSPATATTHTGH